jgi:hypothetical protein
MTIRSAFVFLLVCVAGTSASASEPILIRRAVDVTVAQASLSRICGFTILRRTEGLVDAALFLDQTGNPVREIDTSPTLRITFFSPQTGKSVSFPGTGAATTDFLDDGTAIVSLDGFLTMIRQQGRPLLISVGRLVFSAEVIGTNGDGLPVTGPPTEILFDSGVESGSIIGACQALAP